MSPSLAVPAPEVVTQSVPAPLGRAGHAVVIGGGMGGLMAARVLADHCEQVTLVERDTLTDSLETRKCVPQGRILHAMLPRGQGIPERLFPGYGQDLAAAGAVRLRLPADGLVLTPFGWLVSAAMRLQYHYLDRVVAAATRDPATADTYIRVMGLLAAPTALFAPRVPAAAARARPRAENAPYELPIHPQVSAAR